MWNRIIHLGHPDAHVPAFEIPERAAPPPKPSMLLAGAAIAVALALAGFAAEHVGHSAAPANVPLYWATPFIVLLAAIALMPFLAGHWWERNYARVSIALTAIVAGYYLLFVKRGPANLARSSGEYISFIFLLASLYLVSGGILIRVRARATPLANTSLLLIGAILANLFGTTGAAVLLIRPLLRMNARHIRPYHVVFFIFIVANAGGSLTPIGDPPLFLGYLKGVPFFWVLEHCWQIWMLAIGALLVTFFVIDSIAQRGRHHVKRDADDLGPAVSIFGAANLPLIGLIVLAVVLLSAPWRELLMAGAALASLFITPHRIHVENRFNFAPIREVAVLFVGIFATMLPALNYLSHAHERHGNPLRTPGQYYFVCGALSSMLDNAPTYLTFLTAELATIEPADAQADDAARIAMLIDDPRRNHFLIAISMGAVLFGAATYIGNGPNFMVKSIAENAGVVMPGFIGYVLCFSLPILAPVLIMIWLMFLR